MAEQTWKTLDRFLDLRSRWMTLIGEHLETETGEVLEYWRVERADSAIVLPLWQHHLLLPLPMFRPGVGEATLDFPGGRVPTGKTAAEVVSEILSKELGIPAEAIERLEPVNSQGWAINSSFSNQRLYGFVAQLHSDASVSAALLGARYPATAAGVGELLQQLSCLQCRAVLLEWWQANALAIEE
jgi:hypothetical protein